MSTLIGKKASRGRNQRNNNTTSPGSLHETSFSELQHKLVDDLSSQGSAEEARKKGGIFSMIKSKISRRKTLNDDAELPPPSHPRPDSTFDLKYSADKKKRPAGFKEASVDTPLLERHANSRRNTLDDLEETELDVLNDVNAVVGAPKLTRGREVIPSVLQSKKIERLKPGQGKSRSNVLPSIIIETEVNPSRQMPSVIQDQQGSRIMPSILVENTSNNFTKKVAGHSALSNPDTPKSNRRKRRKKRKKGTTKKREKEENIADFI